MTQITKPMTKPMTKRQIEKRVKEFFKDCPKVTAKDFRVLEKAAKELDDEFSLVRVFCGISRLEWCHIEIKTQDRLIALARLFIGLKRNQQNER